MSAGLYVLVLDGSASRKVHAPDCGWVARTAGKVVPDRPQMKWRTYELRPAHAVSGEPCRRCGGTPGPPVGGWPIRR